MKLAQTKPAPEFIPASQPFKSGTIVEDNDLDALFKAGVTSLRTRKDHFRLTTYPTEPIDTQLLRAVHIAVRSGDFYRLSKLTKEVVFGLTMPPETYNWLKNSPPGKPEQDVIKYLQLLAYRKGDTSILEGQLDPAIATQVFAKHKHGIPDPSGEHFKPEDWDDFADKQIPDCIHDSESNHFNLDIGAAYLRPDDWQRIVKDKQPDTMQRAESRSDLWREWMQAVTKRMVGEVAPESPEIS